MRHQRSTPINASAFFGDDLSEFTNPQLEQALDTLTEGRMNQFHHDAAQRVAQEMQERNMLTEEELRERQLAQ